MQKFKGQACFKPEFYFLLLFLAENNDNGKDDDTLSYVFHNNGSFL